MASWKKVIVSGSQAHLQGITASNIPSASNTNVLLYNSQSGQFSYLSTSSIGNVQGSGANTQVTFWTGPNTIAGDAGLTYNAGTDVLTIGNSTFGNNITASGNISASGNLSVTGTSTLTGNSTIGGTLGVTGVTTLTGRLNANGAISTTNITASNIPSASNANVLLYNSASGVFTYIPTSSLVPTNAFLQGGNSFGATAVLGTNDTQNLQFETNNSVRMTIGTSGNVGIGTAGPNAQLETTEDIIVHGVNIGMGTGNQATNTRVGTGALAANNTGTGNTAVGNAALSSISNGSNSTAVGHQTLRNTTGVSNTAVGAGALQENTTGNHNTAVGVDAGRYGQTNQVLNQLGNQSVFLGADTKANSDAGSTNEIVIGYNAIGAGDNSIVLGNTSITKTFLRSGVGIGLSNNQTPSNTLQVSGSLWTTTITASNIPSASNAHVLLYNSASGQFSYLSTSSVGNVFGNATPGQATYWIGPNTITGDNNFKFGNGGYGKLTISEYIELYRDPATTTGHLDYTLSNTTFNLLNGGYVNSINFGGGAANINIGNTTTGTVTIAGNLVVNGDTTVINTSTLSIEDKFIVLGRSSGSQAPASEGGIIVEGAGGNGSAFVFNSGSGVDVSNRWGLALNVSTASSDVNPTDFMVSVSSSGAAPSTAPTYGGSNGGFGNMHIESNGEIWIYS